MGGGDRAASVAHIVWLLAALDRKRRYPAIRKGRRSTFAAPLLHFAIAPKLLAFGIDLLLFVLVHFLHDGIATGFAGGLSCRGRRGVVRQGSLPGRRRRRPRCGCAR